MQRVLGLVSVLVLVLPGCMGSGEATSSIAIRVDDVPSDQTAFSYEGTTKHPSDPFTALDQLMLFADENGIELNTTYYESLGSTFVNSIGGLAGQEGPGGGFYFWTFLHNGEVSDLAADLVVLSDGDRVEWAYVLEFFGPPLLFTLEVPEATNGTVLNRPNVTAVVSADFDIALNVTESDTGTPVVEREISSGQRDNISLPLAFGFNNFTFTAVSPSYGNYSTNLSLVDLLPSVLRVDGNRTHPAYPRDVPPFHLDYNASVNADVRFVPDREAYTVLDQLLWMNATFGVEVVTSYDSELDSYFVERINGEGQAPEGGATGYFWWFCYNGQSSDFAADDVPLMPEDVVLWKLVVFPDDLAPDLEPC